MIQTIKKNPYFFILAAAFILGAYLHFANWHGAIYLDEDEARPFTLMSSGPLIYLMSRPVYNLFRVQESVFYFVSLLGFISVFLFYRCVRLVFDEKLAIFSVLFYALWPLRINYARTLFPAPFIEFGFMLTFFCLLQALVREKRILFVAAGALAAAMLFVHVYAYALCVGLFTVIWVWPGKQRVKNSAFFIGGALTGGFFLQALFYKIGNGYDYIRNTLYFGKTTSMFTKFPLKPLMELGDRISHSPQAMLVSAVAFIGAFLFLFSVIRSKDRRQMAFLAIYGVGAVIFSLLGLLNVHTLYERHFVWLSSWMALGSAYWLGRMKLGKVLMAGFATLLFIESFFIVRETFKISALRDQLQMQGIKNEEILTSWWQIVDTRLNSKTTRIVSSIPGFFSKVGVDSGYPLFANADGLYGVRYVIDWNSIYTAYKRNLCAYILTSGLNLRAQIGFREEILKHVKPVAVWPHPYAAFTRRPYHETNPHTYEIALYKLSDIFSPQNVTALKQERNH